jgi:hypothetical protein
MSLSVEAFTGWIANYYAAATLLLLLAVVARLLIRHPAMRVALGWSSVVGLLLLAVLSTIPGYPRLHLRSAHLTAIPVTQSPQLADETPVTELPATVNTSKDRHSSVIRSDSASESRIPSVPPWEVMASWGYRPVLSVKVVD